MNDQSRNEQPPPFSCKFIRADDTEPRNEILRRPPRSVEEWIESVDRCTEIVNERLDEIERRIMAKTAE